MFQEKIKGVVQIWHMLTIGDSSFVLFLQLFCKFEFIYKINFKMGVKKSEMIFVSILS